MKAIKYRRTSEIKLSNKSKLLREIRINSNLSLREVGRRMNCSESFIRHIETGRLDFPGPEKLNQILSIYGVTFRQFNKRLKYFRDEDIFNRIVKKLGALEKDKQKMILEVIERLLK